MDKQLVLEHIRHINPIIGMPEEVLPMIEDMVEKIYSEWDFQSKCAGIVVSLFASHNISRTPIDELAKEKQVDAPMLALTIAEICSFKMKQNYISRGLPLDIYYDSIKDIAIWTLHYHTNSDNWGLQEFSWIAMSCIGKVVRLGRLEFELINAQEKSLPITLCGITIDKGSKVINIHIPEGDGITKEKRFDSYRRAYDFFNQTGHAVFMCSSWLLYPEHLNILPETSNIIDFMSDFHIYNSHEENGHLYRVFGRYWTECNGDYSKLPQNTSVRRAFVKHLNAGGSAGEGLGFFVFDGKNIIS